MLGEPIGQSPERKPLIPLQRSIIPACDMSDIDQFERLVKETGDIPGIGGYKVGLELVIPYGLTEVVRRSREHAQLPIILDWQKAGNDIPDMGGKFARASKRAGAEAVILFPFTGPATETSWIEAAQGEGLTVIVGGHMTHPKFLESEGGSISNEAPRRIYTLAVEKGVRDFVVPGNKPEMVTEYRELFEELLGEGNFTLYAPGFIAQGGSITEAGKAAGDKFHAIVGRYIIEAPDMRQAALELTSQLEVAVSQESGEVSVFQKERAESRPPAREERVKQLLSDTGAVITDSHIVYTSGRHGKDYVNKDAVYPHTRETAEFCAMFAQDFAGSNVEVVAAPAVGGVVLSHETAAQLTKLTGKDILGVHAEKDAEGNFAFGRGYADQIKGRRVLVVEDVLTTGGSAKKVIDAVRDAGGEVVGLGVLCNRGGVNPEDLGVDAIDALLSVQMESWAEEDCGLCKDGVAVNTTVGKGKAFLEKQHAVSSN